MWSCTAPNCDSDLRKKKFFAFPADVERRKLWSLKCKMSGLPPSNAKICVDHFEKNQFLLGQDVKKLKPDAVPSLFFGSDGIKSDCEKKPMSEHQFLEYKSVPKQKSPENKVKRESPKKGTINSVPSLFSDPVIIPKGKNHIKHPESLSLPQKQEKKKLKSSSSTFLVETKKYQKHEKNNCLMPDKKHEPSNNSLQHSGKGHESKDCNKHLMPGSSSFVPYRCASYPKSPQSSCSTDTASSPESRFSNKAKELAAAENSVSVMDQGIEQRVENGEQELENSSKEIIEDPLGENSHTPSTKGCTTPPVQPVSLDSRLQQFSFSSSNDGIFNNNNKNLPYFQKPLIPEILNIINKSLGDEEDDVSKSNQLDPPLGAHLVLYSDSSSDSDSNSGPLSTPSEVISPDVKISPDENKQKFIEKNTLKRDVLANEDKAREECSPSASPDIQVSFGAEKPKMDGSHRNVKTKEVQSKNCFNSPLEKSAETSNSLLSEKGNMKLPDIPVTRELSSKQLSPSFDIVIKDTKVCSIENVQVDEKSAEIRTYHYINQKLVKEPSKNSYNSLTKEKVEAKCDELSEKNHNGAACVNDFVLQIHRVRSLGVFDPISDKIVNAITPTLGSTELSPGNECRDLSMTKILVEAKELETTQHLSSREIPEACNRPLLNGVTESVEALVVYVCNFSKSQEAKIPPAKNVKNLQLCKNSAELRKQNSNAKTLSRGKSCSQLSFNSTNLSSFSVYPEVTVSAKEVKTLQSSENSVEIKRQETNSKNLKKSKSCSQLLSNNETKMKCDQTSTTELADSVMINYESLMKSLYASPEKASSSTPNLAVKKNLPKFKAEKKSNSLPTKKKSPLVKGNELLNPETKSKKKLPSSDAKQKCVPSIKRFVTIHNQVFEVLGSSNLRGTTSSSKPKYILIPVVKALKNNPECATNNKQPVSNSSSFVLDRSLTNRQVVKRKSNGCDEDFKAKQFCQATYSKNKQPESNSSTIAFDKRLLDRLVVKRKSNECDEDFDAKQFCETVYSNNKQPESNSSLFVLDRSLDNRQVVKRKSNVCDEDFNAKQFCQATYSKNKQPESNSSTIVLDRSFLNRIVAQQNSNGCDEDFNAKQFCQATYSKNKQPSLASRLILNEKSSRENSYKSRVEGESSTADAILQKDISSDNQQTPLNTSAIEFYQQILKPNFNDGEDLAQAISQMKKWTELLTRELTNLRENYKSMHEKYDESLLSQHLQEKDNKRLRKVNVEKEKHIANLERNIVGYKKLESDWRLKVSALSMRCCVHLERLQITFPLGQSVARKLPDCTVGKSSQASSLSSPGPSAQTDEEEVIRVKKKSFDTKQLEFQRKLLKMLKIKNENKKIDLLIKEFEKEQENDQLKQKIRELECENRSMLEENEGMLEEIDQHIKENKKLSLRVEFFEKQQARKNQWPKKGTATSFPPPLNSSKPHDLERKLGATKQPETNQKQPTSNNSGIHPKQPVSSASTDSRPAQLSLVHPPS